MLFDVIISFWLIGYGVLLGDNNLGFLYVVFLISIWLVGYLVLSVDEFEEN